MPRGSLPQMRHLVDLVTQYVTESQMVLGSDTIDSLISQATAHAETMGSDAQSLEADAGPAGFKSWREAAESERAMRALAERQRGISRADLHEVCKLLTVARQKISFLVTPAANLASEVCRQEAIAHLDAALAIRHSIPVPGDAARYRRLRLIGYGGASGADAALSGEALDAFVDTDLMLNPEGDDNAFAFMETPAESALRAIASALGIGGYNAPIVDADKFQANILEEIGALEKVRARLIPAGARPAARLTVTAAVEGGEPEIIEVAVVTKFPEGVHELFALPVSILPETREPEKPPVVAIIEP